MTFGSNTNRQTSSAVSQIQKSKISKTSKIPQKPTGNQKSQKIDTNSHATNMNPPTIIETHHKSVTNNSVLVQPPKIDTTGAQPDKKGVTVTVTVGSGCSSPRGRFISNDTSHLPPPPLFYGACARNRVNVQVFADPKNN